MKEVIIDSGGGLLLVAGKEGGALLPESPAAEEGAAYTFEMDGEKCAVRRASDADLTRGYLTSDIRASYDLLPPLHHRMAVKGAELLKLDLATRHCGYCGALMRRGTDGLGKVCPECGREAFPQVSPCVIVLITRGDEVLLVRGRNMRGGVHGLVAGYVETGETLEECVRREVREETSLEIDNIRYIGSQPWPNPANLMCAFRAEYAGGELRFADGELRGGGFFRRDALPELPSGSSIARRLIEQWVAGSL